MKAGRKEISAPRAAVRHGRRTYPFEILIFVSGFEFATDVNEHIAVVFAHHLYIVEIIRKRFSQIDRGHLFAVFEHIQRRRFRSVFKIEIGNAVVADLRGFFVHAEEDARFARRACHLDGSVEFESVFQSFVPFYFQIGNELFALVDAGESEIRIVYDVAAVLENFIFLRHARRIQHRRIREIRFLHQRAVLFFHLEIVDGNISFEIYVRVMRLFGEGTELCQNAALCIFLRFSAQGFSGDDEIPVSGIFLVDLEREPIPVPRVQRTVHLVPHRAAVPVSAIIRTRARIYPHGGKIDIAGRAVVDARHETRQIQLCRLRIGA